MNTESPLILKIVPPDEVLSMDSPRPVSSQGFRVEDALTGRLVAGVHSATWTARANEAVRLTVETFVVDPLTYTEGEATIIHVCAKCFAALDMERTGHSRPLMERTELHDTVRVYEALKPLEKEQ